MSSPTTATERPELAASAALDSLALEVTACTACPRLRAYCLEVARVRVRRFAAQEYWGLPVPGYGDPEARVLIVGLAPAAHGANRTGRMFTGDRSGDFLYAGLYRAGLANQPQSLHRGDGLRLRGVYISAAARCAPPGNKPTPDELARCRPYLLRELELLGGLRVVVALGAIGHDAYLRAVRNRGLAAGPLPRFRHGAEHRLGPAEGAGLPALPVLIDCYHVSQQNTFTGRLTPSMLDQILCRAKDLASLF